MKDIDDLETWIIETGDSIIQKENTSGPNSLTTAERAVYDLWAVDYAVRNAGDMQALTDLRPNAAADLAAFLRIQGQADLAKTVSKLSNSGGDCDSYYDIFDKLCTTVRAALGS